MEGAGENSRFFRNFPLFPRWVLWYNGYNPAPGASGGKTTQRMDDTVKHAKWWAALLAAALAFCLPLAAAAETFSTEDFSLEVPEGMFQFTRSTPADDPSWALAGIAEPQDKLEEYQEMNGVLEMVSQDGEDHILVTQSASEESQEIFNLKYLSEEERAQFLDEVAQVKTDELKLEKEYIDINGQPFYRIRFEGVYQEIGYNELVIGTIVNGYSLNLDTYGNLEAVPQEREDLMLSIAQTITFPEILAKPAPSVMDTHKALFTLGLLAVLVVVFLAPLIYFPIRNKRDKKRKAVLAEKLTAYHQTHGNNETIAGEMLFSNTTECTKEAIHTFCVYQAYVKNIGVLVLGAVLSLATLAVSFLVEAEWWLMLLSFGVVGYYGYKIFSAPHTLEKIQRRVFDRGVSNKAHYAFYDEAFRVSGIQSASVFPYFQLTDVRRHNHYIYLYYGPENAYMVDQFGFSVGEWDDFVTFIGQKTGKKL